MHGFGIVLLIGGGILGFFGVQEFIVARGTTAEPAEIDLAEVEGGASIDNPHVKIGAHYRIYPMCVFEYEYPEHETRSEPKDGDTVTHAYYPVISESHPFVVRLNEVAEQHGGIENIPEEDFPVIETFSILVKTTSFKTVGSIPDDWDGSDEIHGLLINRISSLGSEEENLLKESFPMIDTSTLHILEQDRTPFSVGGALGMAGGGILVIVLGVVCFIVGSRQSRPQLMTM